MFGSSIFWSIHFCFNQVLYQVRMVTLQTPHTDTIVLLLNIFLALIFLIPS
ncbi:hypothetical protein C1645_818438 [Glomus cerebriforme]|uniref:Uncharacterized protein n=1 Tax=Glomus cerebriforme TaxID=658196 RepID=A0A397T8E2_9GLOM|nr:hypothetical protein C1645_818438 [Glomus cerebriforme]